MKRLVVVWALFFGFVGCPIAYQTFDPADQPAEFGLSATVGGLLVVAAVVVRVYLGWSFVGNRLLSATVEYEETGWCVGGRRRARLMSVLIHPATVRVYRAMLHLRKNVPGELNSSMCWPDVSWLSMIMTTGMMLWTKQVLGRLRHVYLLHAPPGHRKRC